MEGILYRRHASVSLGLSRIVSADTKEEAERERKTGPQTPLSVPPRPWTLDPLRPWSHMEAARARETGPGEVHSPPNDKTAASAEFPPADARSRHFAAENRGDTAADDRADRDRTPESLPPVPFPSVGSPTLLNQLGWRSATTPPVQPSGLPRFFGDLLAGVAEHGGQPLPHRHQAAFGELRLQGVLKDRHHVADGDPEAVVEPDRENHDAMADRGLASHRPRQG